MEFENTNDMSFKIENFEGPLDLLLQLIKQSKLSIEEVKLSDITEQYLKVIEQLSKVDMEKASEFIEIAATLIEIKSKSLLPRLEEEGEDVDEDADLLKKRLMEYQMLKETTEKLKPLENTDRFYKKPEPDANKFRYILKDMQLDMLLDAFSHIMLRVNETKKEDEVKEIIKEKFTVHQKISTIKDSLMTRKKMYFSELFSNSISRDEVVTTFMALLELLKLQEIRVEQQENFAEIEISKVEEV